MFSVILPVHNEEYMLRRVFSTIINIDPDETIIILDRCIDNSEKVVLSFVNKYNLNVRFIRVDAKSSWKIHLNYLYNLGISEASHDILLLTQADIALDSKIKDYIDLAKSHIIFLGYLMYLGWNTIASTLLFKLPIISRSTGLIILRRDWALKYNFIENLDLLYDTQIALKVRKFSIPSRFIMTRSWNLRPYVRSKLYDMGRTWYRLGKSLFRTSIVSLFRLQPEILVGYLQCKFRGD